MIYYHGTSIPNLKVILPPIETRVFREDYLILDSGTAAEYIE